MSSPHISPSFPAPEASCPVRAAFERSAGGGQAPVSPGGVRVIYFTRTTEKEVVLLLIYAKAKTDNITGSKLKEIRRVIEN